MFKKLCLILITIIALNANDFGEKIINIIGQDKYNKNKSLINHIFANESLYYMNGVINYIPVMEKLKSNGLLTVGLSSPKSVTIIFIINKDPIKSLEIISNALKSLGYYYYFTKSLAYNENKNLVWTINFKTEAVIDPLVLSKELAKQNCRLNDIKKEGETKWIYDIDTSNSVLSKASYITTNEKVSFRKPLRPYLIKIDEDAKQIKINSGYANKWFPNIVFYDEHLNILKIVKQNKQTKSFLLDIPQETKYIKINDIYTLANIRHGLNVTIKE